MREKINEKLSFFRGFFKEKAGRFSEAPIGMKIVASSILAGIAILIVAMIIGGRGTSKEITIENFRNSIESGDVKLFAKTVRVDGKKVSISSIEPLMKYYTKKADTVLDVVKGLRVDDKSGILSVKKDDSLFGEQYYIDVHKVDVTVNSNIKDTEVVLNEFKVKSGEVFKDVIPGIYIVNYSLKTDFGYITGEEEVTVLDGQSIDVYVDAGYISLYSDFPDADVYISGKNIGKKASEIIDYGPIPFNKNLSLYIENEFPWGKIKSDEVAISSNGIVKVDLNMVNDKLMIEVDDSLNIFFDSVFEALNEKDKSLIQNADEDVKNKIYDDIFKKSLIIPNNYRISDLNLKIENSEFRSDDKSYKGSIVVKINYDIYKELMPFIKESREELFLVGIYYDDGKWNAESVQRFNMIEEN